MAARKKTTTGTEDTVVASETVKTVEEVKEPKVSKMTKEINAIPLVDTDEIEVISLIPHVSYKDSKTNDMYEWDEVGHVELMTVETLKNMWRNNKGYFRNLWLKPDDERIIKQFGLTSTFEKYEYLMNESNYTRTNISEICKAISSAPNGMKFAICNKVKALVQEGKVADITVIKALERHLNLELVSLL